MLYLAQCSPNFLLFQCSQLSEPQALVASSVEILQQQTMLRISALASMHDRMIEILKNLASLTLPRDLPLGISYLLALPEVSMVIFTLF